jgi:acetolactate synthase I/II/III large subunit
MTPSVKLSDYVMDFLVARGVRHVFMLPGGGAMHLDDSLGACEGLEYTVFLHEQALAIAAEAYGQYTNEPGVGLVTSGPGSTNAITGVTAAFLDSTPCVFISGQAKRPDLKMDSGVRQMGSQEVDIVAMVSPVTKYAVTVLEPAEIRYHLERAWHEATSGRMGPVWIDIPLDVQAAMLDAEALTGFTPQPSADPARLDEPVTRIVALLNASERPAILMGNGAKLAGAQDLVRRFAESNEIPVLLTWKTIDCLGYEHPLNFGSPGIMGCRTANFIVQNCDLLLIVGSRLEPSVTAFDSAAFGRNAKKVMVDVDEAEIRKIKGVEVAVVADAGEFARALGDRQAEVEPRDRASWLAYCRRLQERYPVVLDEYREEDGINLYAFTDLLFDLLNDDDVITPESSGAAGEATYQAMRVKQGQMIKNAAGLGAMGFGLPYAIGACIATGGRRTVLINGDGAFQLNIQELETLARLRLPVKMFILDNGGYGSIVATQRNLFDGRLVGSSPDSGLTLPDLCAVAGAYGIRSEEAGTYDGLASAIERTLAGEDPALCKVRVSASHVTAPKVQAMKTPDGGMISKPLEDMWPYLSAEELADNMLAERGSSTKRGQETR